MQLAAFVTEVTNSRLPATEADRDITMDQAVERYLTEYLAKEKGRATATIKNYRQLHKKWFSPKIGGKRVRDVADEVMDRIAGEMREAGLSVSRLNDVRSLYGPFFRWARRGGYTRHNPMAEFEVPPSDQVPDERVPPEVDQMCRYIEAAVEVIPNVTPVLTLYAVTGRRRAEMTALRRSRIYPSDLKIKVDVANDRPQFRIAVRPAVGWFHRVWREIDLPVAPLGDLPIRATSAVTLV